MYRITVEGEVPEGFLDRLGGLKIVESSPASTTLEGRLPDQAAVMGTLDALYGLHLPLVEVVCIENCE